MFSFHTSAFKSIKPQNWKVIGFTVISAIMLAIMTFASYILLGLSTQGLQQQQMQAQLGGGSGNTASAWLPVIAAIVLVALLWILLAYPVFSSLIYMISKATRGETVNIRDIFSTFFKGRYAKALLMGLISFIMFIIYLIINGLIIYLYSELLNLILKQFANSLQNSSNQMTIFTTIQIINGILTSLIIAILTIILAMIVINMTTSFVNDINRSVGTNVKNGFKGIKNGHKTWFKFFIGTLLIWLISILINHVLMPIIAINTQQMSQNVVVMIMQTMRIISMIVKVILFYILTVGMVHYFNRNGKKPEKSTKA